MNDYFFLLRLVATCVNPWRERVLFYLAAAVSDFYIPQQEQVEHKIQSRQGPLHLTLQQVPKLLGVLRYDWAPHAFFVSFKLETNEDVLRSKAHQSIVQYGMHVVVANELTTRFDQVIVITADDERIINRPIENEDIEEGLIEALASIHFQYIGTQQVTVPDLIGTKHMTKPWQQRLQLHFSQVMEFHQHEIIGIVLGGMISVMLHWFQTTRR